MANAFMDSSILSGQIQGRFSFEKIKQTAWTKVFYEFSPGDVSDSEDEDEEEDRDEDVIGGTPLEILRFNTDENVVLIFPYKKNVSDKFPSRRYKRIETISLEGFHFEYPDNAEPDSVAELLFAFPSGFTQNPDFGLGLWKDYRFIIEAIETNPQIKHVQVSRKRENAITGDTYILNFSTYDATRKAINNVHAHALEIAREDKSILAHNSLLHELDKKTYPKRYRSYKSDTIFKTVHGRVIPDLSTKDQLAAVNLVEQSSASLAKNHRHKLMELQREIELVTLKQLIDEMDNRIQKKILEEDWQKFFVDHPFVLSLAFSLPLVVIDGQVSVGGRGFSGKGDKIADFLVKNGLTDNLTLIEIKTPQAKLLGKEYRKDIYSPSVDLVGSVAQILDQRRHLQAELNVLKSNSRQFEIEAYAVRCLIIIGITPSELVLKKSLELFRNSLHDVLVITFDELIEKLRHLYSFLASNEKKTKPS